MRARLFPPQPPRNKHTLHSSDPLQNTRLASNATHVLCLLKEAGGRGGEEKTPSTKSREHRRCLLLCLTSALLWMEIRVLCLTSALLLWMEIRGQTPLNPPPAALRVLGFSRSWGETAEVQRRGKALPRPDLGKKGHQGDVGL